MARVNIADAPVILRTGHDAVALTGWGSFWLLLFLVAVSR